MSGFKNGNKHKKQIASGSDSDDSDDSQNNKLAIISSNGNNNNNSSDSDSDSESDANNSDNEDNDSIDSDKDAKKAKDKGKKKSNAAYHSNLTWGSDKIETAILHFIDGSIWYHQNGVPRTKRYIFSNPSSKANLSETPTTFRLPMDTSNTTNKAMLAFIFSKVSQVGSDTIEAHFKALAAKPDSKDTFTILDSASVILSHLKVDTVFVSRQDCPVEMNITGMNGKYRNPAKFNGNPSGSSLVVLQHGMRAVKIAGSNVLSAPHKYAFNGEFNYVTRINSKTPLDKKMEPTLVNPVTNSRERLFDISQWGPEINGLVNINMDTALFWWFVHYLPELIMDFFATHPTKQLTGITDDIKKSISKFLKHHPVPNIYDKDVKLDTNYGGRVMNVVNPQMNPSSDESKSSTKQACWAIDTHSDVYRAPREFVEFCITKYKDTVSDIQMLNPTQLELTYSPASPGEKPFEKTDVVVFTVKIITFSPKMFVYTTNKKHEKK